VLKTYDHVEPRLRIMPELNSPSAIGETPLVTV
jgi:hypothetical protein